MGGDASHPRRPPPAVVHRPPSRDSEPSQSTNETSGCRRYADPSVSQHRPPARPRERLMPRTTPRRRSLSLVGGAVAAVAALVVAGRAPADSDGKATSASSTSTTANACTKANLQTPTPGTLTIATEEPGFH